MAMQGVKTLRSDKTEMIQEQQDDRYIGLNDDELVVANLVAISFGIFSFRFLHDRVFPKSRDSTFCQFEMDGRMSFTYNY
jgi:hypothetical protein